MNIKLLKGKTVWITGASSGIGLEMTLQAAAAGAKLYLFSSRKEPLAEAAGLSAARGALSVQFEVVDLSDTDAAVAASEKTLELSGAPDYLILNAGVSQRSMAAETDLSVTRSILNLNFFGAVSVARTVLPAMISRGGGSIAVTSSVTGVFGFPMRSAYAASKHALHGYCESVGLEYASDGIKVTLIIPGRIRTPISINSLTADGKKHGKMDPGQEKGMDAALCAEKYWRAVIRGKHEAVIGGFDTIMVFFHRYMPWVFRHIAIKVSPV
ncbi:MAG: SDR family NAD(P)-dependent oxidoreductase [Spirochaetaceae bacterium]|nr:SDR family NAD(P)-dependent oxidoreductase [Spirochaetaceae bacterium]